MPAARTVEGEQLQYRQKWIKLDLVNYKVKHIYGKEKYCAFGRGCRGHKGQNLYEYATDIKPSESHSYF